MITIILCAILCAVVILWVFKPIHKHTCFYTVCLVAAVSTLGLYTLFGHPDLPTASISTPKDAQADYRQMMLDEFTMMNRLSKNDTDADAMIRLAAIRLAQGRTDEATQRLLARAAEITPHDKRLKAIQNILQE
jgi:cytochrome c-type biogenesis protein CcmH/NrfG